jgi:hypothetical protein
VTLGGQALEEEPDKVCPTTIIGQEGLFKLGKANPPEGLSPNIKSLVPPGSEFVRRVGSPPKEKFTSFISLKEISRKVLVLTYILTHSWS